MKKKKDKRKTSSSEAAAGTAAGISACGEIPIPKISEPKVLGRESLFLEANHQCKPLATPGSGLEQRTVKLVREGSARHPQLKEETARRMITAEKSLDDLIKGCYPNASAAEIVTVHDYKLQQQGIDSGMVNPSAHNAHNVVDVRIAADTQSKRDILFLISNEKKGLQFYRSGGQVKTGQPEYLVKSLEKMATRSGYGNTAIVDARFINPDGSPRIAKNAFTSHQAKRLQKTGLRLRGIKDLDGRANQLTTDIRTAGKDGLRPLERVKLEGLRSDIEKAYQGKAITQRMIGGAAVAAASSALISLTLQIAINGEVDTMELGKASAKSALYGGGGAILDAMIYKGGLSSGLAPEIAKKLAQQGVVAGFCLLAIGADAYSEITAMSKGEISGASAASGIAAKTALNILPFVLAPLGLVGVPILLGAQLGGRWAISNLREGDAQLASARKANQAFAEEIQQDSINLSEKIYRFEAECQAVDDMFHQIMGQTSAPKSNFHY